jgi:aspartyl-tRNA(Asn)/glutamyl-tRNA(Gln) amidotransferase subunit B
MNKLPELPRERRLRLQEEYDLLPENIETLVANKNLGNYFEEVASELTEWLACEGEKIDEKKKTKVYRLANSYLITNLSKLMSDNETAVKDLKITAENFAEMIKMIHLGEINSSVAQTILEEMFKTGGDPSQIVEEKDLGQVSDSGELEKVVSEILSAYPEAVTDYKAGKENSIKFLMGQVMKETKGKANPPMVMEMLKKKME